MNKSLSVSIVMPALDEEANVFVAISETLQAFDSYNINGEIIVVNDGSKDKTPEIIEEFCKKDQRVKMISHTSPQGIGASFWDGVDHSMNEAISMLPGDGENNPGEIIRYLNLLNHVDMVIPFVFNPQVRPLWRSALSFVYRFIVNTTFLVNFNYTNGTVLYRKTVLEALSIRNQSFFFQTDILIRSAKRGYLFAEVPYCLGTRGSGDSKAVSYPSLMRVIKGYLRLLKDFYFNKEWNTRKPFAENTSTAQRYKSSPK
jgi:dolichol-phosphate mannosyltransferase